MSYKPRWSDTARIRMDQYNLKEWQVLRAFESSDRSYTEDGATLSRAKVDGKLISTVHRKLDSGDHLIITLWAKDLQEPDRDYRQRYGRYRK